MKLEIFLYLYLIQARMTDNRWTIRSTEWKPRDGRRIVGRSPKRWMDDIASYLCSIDTINGKLWHRYAQNRKGGRLECLGNDDLRRRQIYEVGT